MGQLSTAQQRHREIVRLVLSGKRTKEISSDVGMSDAYVHTTIREAGFVFMRVTKAERATIMQARERAGLLSADQAATRPVELKHQPKTTQPGRRETILGERA